MSSRSIVLRDVTHWSEEFETRRARRDVFMKIKIELEGVLNNEVVQKLDQAAMLIETSMEVTNEGLNKCRNLLAQDFSEVLQPAQNSLQETEYKLASCMYRLNHDETAIFISVIEDVELCSVNLARKKTLFVCDAVRGSPEQHAALKNKASELYKYEEV